MQDSYDKYFHYSATDFAMDDDFINWVLFPDDENDTFWNEFVINNPNQYKNIETAKSIIFSFDTKTEKVPDEIKNRIWDSVISKAGNGRVVRMKSRRLWMVAASLLILVMASISYFYFSKNENKEMQRTVAKKTNQKNDILPGGNKAILTLANGTNIILDSAQNGMLTKQGNAKVIKLQNGKVAYQKRENGHVAKVEYNTITTPRGGQYQLVLADGSKVWLNAASSIHFPTAFTGNERNVEITGEAYFEVEHIATMPFHVKVNNADVAVMGTHFNINAYDDEGVMKTTLLEGSVKVSKGNESIFITPGEQAEVSNSSNNIEVKKDVDLDEVVAWKNGYFYFNQASVQTVMNQLSRWYDVDIQYTGTIPKRQFDGEMQRSLTLSQVLKLLSQNKVNFQIEGKKIIITP